MGSSCTLVHWCTGWYLIYTICIYIGNLMLGLETDIEAVWKKYFPRNISFKHIKEGKRNLITLRLQYFHSRMVGNENYLWHHSSITWEKWCTSFGKIQSFSFASNRKTAFGLQDTFVVRTRIRSKLQRSLKKSCVEMDHVSSINFHYHQLTNLIFFSALISRFWE